MVKVFLHISKDEQRARLQARIDDPEKNWKFRRADLEVRAQWDEYQDALRGGDHRHLHRAGRRGTSCRPTTSGCATSPWPRCSSTCSTELDPQIPDPGARPRGPRRRVVRPRFRIVDWSARRSIDQNGYSMDVESRDSVSLKPAELDELGQLVSGMGLPLQDEQLDRHVEQFPLVAVAESTREIHGFLFGSLERIGGTPCILWGLGAVTTGPQRPAEPRRPRRRALPPGGDLVPRRGRARRGSGRAPGGLLAARGARRRVPAPEVHAERRGAGLGPAPGPPVRLRRPLRRPHASGSSGHGAPELVLDARHGEGRRQGRRRAGRRGRPRQRRGAHRLRLGDGRGARRRPRHAPAADRHRLARSADAPVAPAQRGVELGAERRRGR